MEINLNKKTLNSKIDRWNFEADYMAKNSIKIFFYQDYTWGNKFVGFYNPENKTIRPLYYNSNIDYRNGWKPTKRQVKQIEKYCNKLLKNIHE